VLAILLKLNPRNLYLSDLGYPVIFDNIGIPGRNYGVMSHPNGLGQVAALSYIFSVYRYGNKFLIAPAVFCLLKCGSRTAISACVLVSLVIALHKFWPKRVVAQRKKKFSEVFNTVSVVIGVSLTTLFLINLNGLSPDALTGRAQIWQTAKELFNSKLIFGLGWGWEGRAIEANLLNVWAVSAHNAILEVLFSTGFAGLILFLYLITICISGVRNFEPLDKSLLLTLMVFGISESILDIQYPSVTTFIFFLLTLSNRQGRQDEK
jgi:O-antigen ligase